MWNLWVLWNGSYPTPTYGTEWRRYTSTDLVTWSDLGVSIPKYKVTHGTPPVNATTAFADVNAADPLAYAYAIGWQNNWDYAGNMQTPGYWGQLSITRKLRLQLVNGVSILFNAPIDAQNKVFASRVQGTDQTISDGVPYAWPQWPNTPACRIDCTLSPVNGSWPGSFYLSVKGDSHYFTQIGFEPSRSNVFLKRDTGGPAPKSDAAWNNNRTVPCDFSAPVSLSVLVDAGSIEVFLNGGRIAISELLTAPLSASGLNFTAFGGGARVSNLVLWSAA